MEGNFIGRESRIAVVKVDIVATGVRKHCATLNEILFRFVQCRLDYNMRQHWIIQMLFLIINRFLGANNSKCNALQSSIIVRIGFVFKLSQDELIPLGRF